ncbi:helix-turn-helix domain-containing protein [Bradyrhizobium sp. CB82]|uniref:helix-turn-helix domain-containing protein n=1 Tax=Bradyrhizobium sp. CB82 TaxID=3039159 RepID=UPI0024B190BF|nr:helix-turn-helix domain-containing protein [Bradyrhizobium sp. CB82]WFU42565.1 helix-turn-helix domain-containing protein [Bradyrhizobium sp. CB82]
MGIPRSGDTHFLCGMAHGLDIARRVFSRPSYADMAREFRRICAARPYLNHCVVARDVAARAFETSIDHLQSTTRDADNAEVRHKIMAFVYVITGAKFSEIGRVFNRNHSAVSYACGKYADAIRAAIGG